MWKSVVVPIIAVSLLGALGRAEDRRWQPAAAPLVTRWAREVSPDNVHAEYPRPQMVRREWLSLNGLWELAVPAPHEADQASAATKPILAPFPLESALSGVGLHADRATYHREFQVPASWRGRRILLHFGAVDWHAQVKLNGQDVGEHRGGYDPFSFDITDALIGDGDQDLYVMVSDPTDSGAQPHGKQHLKPEGIWYTPTTGIWQTVWLEPVPSSSIERLHIEPDVDRKRLRLTVDVRGARPHQRIEAVALAEGNEVTRDEGAPGTMLELAISQPRLWSPEEPYLYDLQVRLREADQTVDEVQSYFGMRKIEIKPVEGVTRIVLNDRPLFQIGPLDQGFWPDGLYTAPTDEALRYDVEITKRLGYHMTRKHVKVEPDRWYHWCDKLGLLVWQDMPHAHRAARDSQQFQHELRRMVENLSNHPSIIMWIVFNEGWGQHRTEWFTSLVKELDPSRLVSNASGWNDKQVGDVIDIHVYPGPRSPKPEPRRAAVLGEFGGLGLAVEGHVWTEKNWSYRGTEGGEQLTYAYVNLLRRVWQLRDDPGLSAAVYTQLTDVEAEINGLLTYDRAVIKVDVSKVAAANAGRFPSQSVLVATSQKEPATWKYTTSQPAENWTTREFEDSAWAAGQGGFGSEGTPGGVIRTTWNTSGIWLRRLVKLPRFDRQRVALLVHHDEDVEVFINGVAAATAPGFTTDYEWLPLSSEARAALVEGENLIAVHCKQTGGGQYIDLGLVELAW
jgi:hypothetical protein